MTCHRRYRGVIVLAIVALVVMAVAIDPWPGRSRRRSLRTLAKSTPHEIGMVGRVAPHLGLVGEFLLEWDCGGCHGKSPMPPPAKAVEWPAPLAVMRSPHNAGIGACANCHR